MAEANIDSFAMSTDSEPASANGSTDDDAPDHVSESTSYAASEDTSDIVSQDASDENTSNDAWAEASAKEDNMERPVPKEGAV